MIQILILIVALAGDLLSKHFLKAFLLTQSGHNFPIINNVLELQYAENTGASFGIFAGRTWLLIVFTSLMLVALTVYIIMARKEALIYRIGLTMILGGGLGNLIDRIALGYVRDFIYFVPIDFPIFNIADCFIVVGTFIIAIYLIVSIIKEYRARHKPKAEV